MTLNQGSTKQSREETTRYRNFVYDHCDSIDGFQKGRIPKNGLVKTQPYTNTNKGRMYEETNIFYKKYSVSDLNEQAFLKDLERLLGVYQDCAHSYILASDRGIQNSILAISQFNKMVVASQLKIPSSLTSRFISSLCTKPFVILTGLSGSGKTKLAQAFSHWLCRDTSH